MFEAKLLINLTWMYERSLQDIFREMYASSAVEVVYSVKKKHNLADG